MLLTGYYKSSDLYAARMNFKCSTSFAQENRAMSSTEAERELARRTHILARLIERNRAINRTKPTPSGIEPATSISRNAVQLWVKEEEEDLNHVENLRREVRRIAKNGRGSPTGKKPAETDKTSYGSDRRVVLSTKNGVKQNERESESPRLGTTKIEVPAGVPEVNLAAIAVALKVRVKAADMPPLLQEQAFRCARECLDGMARLNSKAVAHALKKVCLLFCRVYVQGSNLICP